MSNSEDAKRSLAKTRELLIKSKQLLRTIEHQDHVIHARPDRFSTVRNDSWKTKIE